MSTLPPTPGARRKPRRRWRQFSLRSLLLLTLIAAIWLAWWTRPERLVTTHAAGAISIESQIFCGADQAPIQHGGWWLSDESGRERVHGRHCLGQPDGLWTIMHENGQKASEGQCVAGKREGLWTAWHDNGQKESEVTYKKHRPHGDAPRWSREGHLASHGRYEEGRREGLWTFFDPKGRKQSAGSYLAGKKEGAWQSWDAKGKKLPEQQYAAGQIVQEGDAERIALWGADLTSADVARRRRAAWALERLAPQAVPELTAALRAPSLEVRRWAASTLAALGPRAKEAVPALIACLEDRDLDVRFYAASALGEIGPAAASAIPKLEAMIDPKDPDLNNVCYLSLANIEPKSPQRLTDLIVGRSYDNSARKWIYDGAMYRLADSQVARLGRALSDPSSKVAIGAARWLEHDRHFSEEPALVAALADPRPAVRAAVAKALGSIGGDNYVVRAALTKAEADPDKKVVKAAKAALQSLQNRGGGGGGAGTGGFF